MQHAFLDSAAGRSLTDAPLFEGGRADASAGSVRPLSSPAHDAPGSGYGARSGSGPKAMAITLAIHAAAILALASAGYSVLEPDPPAVLQVLDMRPQAPPPPPPSQELVVAEVTPVVNRVVAPPVDIQLPTPNPVATTPEPREMPKVAAIAATEPSEASEPAPAAPIVPPNFNAGQLNNPGPAYPFQSKRAREEGVVMLKVLVGTNGRAKTVNVHNSSGHGRLDSAARAAVQKWRFLPATQAGQPVEAWVLVPVTFKLDK